MSHEEIFIRFDCRFISEDAVFGYPDAEQGGPENTQTTDSNCTFQGSHDGGCQGPGNEQWTEPRDPKERRAEKQAPQSAPQCPQLSPMLHPITRVVVAHDLFVRVVVFANHRQS